MSDRDEACYGNTFPDLDRVRRNEALEGRVFGVLVESAGLGVQRRSISITESDQSFSHVET